MKKRMAVLILAIALTQTLGESALAAGDYLAEDGETAFGAEDTYDDYTEEGEWEEKNDAQLQAEFEAAMGDSVALDAGFDDKAYDSRFYGEELDEAFEEAMEDKSLILTEDGIKELELVDSCEEALDGEYEVEIRDYQSEPELTRASSMVSKVEYARTYRIRRKSDNATMVQWVLRGLFVYNGKTSSCKDTAMSCYNNAPKLFKVTSKDHYRAGSYAVGTCKATARKAGKNYSRTIKLKVTADGKVIRS